MISYKFSQFPKWSYTCDGMLFASLESFYLSYVSKYELMNLKSFSSKIKKPNSSISDKEFTGGQINPYSLIVCLFIIFIII